MNSLRFTRSCLVLTAFAFALVGCSTQSLQQVNKDLATLNQALANGPAPVAQEPTAGNAPVGKKTQVIVPNDPAVEAAMNAALPSIRKVVSIHQCVNNPNAMRQLNFYALPGIDFSGWETQKFYPMVGMRYHLARTCVSVTTLDNWSMPALNALVFRAVYFADDSGETASYNLRFMHTGDGNWRLAEIRPIW